MAAGGVQTKPRRHHYVPQWHLRRFAVDSRRARVWRYSKSTDSFACMSVKDAAVIAHYYSGPGQDGPDTSVEEALADLDGAAAAVVGELEDGEELDDADTLVLAAYTTMLQGRVPPARDGQQKVLETLGALQVEMALANAGPDEQEQILADAKADGSARDDEDFDAFAERLIAELRSGRTKVVHHPLATMGAAGIGVNKAAPIVAQMPRMVIEAPPNIEFVICDNPVSLYSPSTPAFMGAGYLTGDVEVTMPLSRRRLLLFSHEPWYQGRCCVTEPFVDHFNSRTWLGAGDYVFASSKEALDRVAALFDSKTRRRAGGGIEITGYP